MCPLGILNTESAPWVPIVVFILLPVPSRRQSLSIRTAIEKPVLPGNHLEHPLVRRSVTYAKVDGVHAEGVDGGPPPRWGSAESRPEEERDATSRSVMERHGGVSPLWKGSVSGEECVPAFTKRST